ELSRSQELLRIKTESETEQFNRARALGEQINLIQSNLHDSAHRSGERIGQLETEAHLRNLAQVEQSSALDEARAVHVVDNNRIAELIAINQRQMEAHHYGERIGQLETEAHLRNLAQAEQSSALDEARALHVEDRIRIAELIAVNQRHIEAIDQNSADVKSLEEVLSGILLRNQALNEQLHRSSIDQVDQDTDTNESDVSQTEHLRGFVDVKNLMLRRSSFSSAMIAQYIIWTATGQLRPRLRSRSTALRDLNLIENSGLFNPHWYQKMYPDLADTSDLAIHYLQFGGFEGRHPSPLFDSNAYRLANGDIDWRRQNTLLHYLHFGISEDRPIQSMPSITVDECIASISVDNGIHYQKSAGFEIRNGNLVSIGNDPQIRYKCVPAMPRGIFFIEAIIKPSGITRPKIYFSVGEEYSESFAVELKHIESDYFRGTVYLDRDVQYIRFDPVDGPGEVRVRALHMRSAGTARNLAFRVGRTVTSIRNSFSFGARSQPGMQANNVLSPAIFERLTQGGSLWPSPSWEQPGSDREKRSYADWIDTHDYISSRDRDTYSKMISLLPIRPLISVVMTTYETNLTFLQEAINSVIEQVYENWELCIADDASSSPQVRHLLEKFAGSDKRIRIIVHESNLGISAATNSAFSLARGDWTALVDHDDILREHALAEVVATINQFPDVELIYSDEDKISEDSNDRFQPFFKPAFSIDLLRSQNYLNHLSVHKSCNIRRVGGWRSDYDGSQDYDLSLRVIEGISFDKIVHIPKILYHWRAAGSSTAKSISYKASAVSAGRTAVSAHLVRSGIKAAVIPAGGQLPYNRVRYAVPASNPLVSIIIPTKDRVELLRKCIDSIVRKTAYRRYEIVIVDDCSNQRET
ncbi:glycosyltransferase, partial [Methylobacterium sp. WL7]|uniref:glycosyltransferase family 2 protein n=1 Tax=Methylobacterium sp. WL7 TaxID=2603900 RepID=UPI0011C84FC3